MKRNKLKRGIFLTMSVLSVVLFLVVTIWLGNHFVSNKKQTLIDAHLSISDRGFVGDFIMGAFLSSVIFLITYIVPTLALRNSNRLLFTVGLSTFGMKKIYHSDLGVFYMKAYKKNGRGDYRISIFDQEVFCLKGIIEIEHEGDVNKIKSDIKGRLDNIYKRILEETTIEKSVENWDGYLDTQGKRDDILNKLVK
jgi:hypothetical protein